MKVVIREINLADLCGLAESGLKPGKPLLIIWKEV